MWYLLVGFSFSIVYGSGAPKFQKMNCIGTDIFLKKKVLIRAENRFSFYNALYVQYNEFRSVD
jgi:hypothetical protein